MSKDKLDLIIKDALKARHKDADNVSLQCLSDGELADYVNSVVAGGVPGEDIADHIVECDSCFSKVASAVSALTSFSKGTSSGRADLSIEKLKSIPRSCPKPGVRGKPFKRNKSLFIAAVFFLLSFVFKSYFLQFLVATAIFGFKWVMDTGGTKALIMIYDAWQQRKGTDEDKKGRYKISSRGRL